MYSSSHFIFTEFLKAINFPPVTTTTTSLSLPGNGISSSFGLHQPTVIQQVPKHSTVSTISQAKLQTIGVFIDNVIIYFCFVIVDIFLWMESVDFLN